MDKLNLTNHQIGVYLLKSAHKIDENTINIHEHMHIIHAIAQTFLIKDTDNLTWSDDYGLVIKQYYDLENEFLKNSLLENLEKHALYLNDPISEVREIINNANGNKFFNLRTKKYIFDLEIKKYSSHILNIDYCKSLFEIFNFNDNATELDNQQ